MGEKLIHIRPSATRDNNGALQPKGVMIDLESNRALPLNRLEYGRIAAVANEGVLKPVQEQVIYLHHEEDGDRAASGALLDLSCDQTKPLSTEDAQRIAEVVRRIEEIESSSYNETIKSQLRRGVEPHIMGKPLWRNLI